LSKKIEKEKKKKERKKKKEAKKKKERKNKKRKREPTKNFFRLDFFKKKNYDLTKLNRKKNTLQTDRQYYLKS
jgi:hypothetical protein